MFFVFIKISVFFCNKNNKYFQPQTHQIEKIVPCYLKSALKTLDDNAAVKRRCDR